MWATSVGRRAYSIREYGTKVGKLDSRNSGTRLAYDFSGVESFAIAIYYTSDDTVWSVPVSYDPEIRFGDPERQFEIRERAGFPRSDTTLSPDGSRFLIMSDDRPRPTAEAEAAERHDPGGHRLELAADGARTLVA